MINNDNKQLSEEEYCHYSGLPSVKFYENIEKEKIMQEKESKTNWHFWISMVKSFIRIGAGFYLCLNEPMAAGCLFIAAECLGILEEF
jgi:hypothetical protein